MIKVLISNETDTSIDKSAIKKGIEKVLIENGHTKNTEVSVAIVKHEKIVELAIKYMGETMEEAKDHPVLSFLKEEIESEFVDPPNDINYLGEILISDKNTSEEVTHWAEHAALHLCGIHHD